MHQTKTWIYWKVWNRQGCLEVNNGNNYEQDITRHRSQPSSNIACIFRFDFDIKVD